MNEPHDRRPASAAEAFGLARTLSWFDGFSIALGVPALLLFSVGSIVVLTGTLSPLIWIVSVTIGLLQAPSTCNANGATRAGAPNPPLRRKPSPRPRR